MKNMPAEVKKLISDGSWSLYTVEGQDWYWLHVPAAPPCCSLHPHPSADYKISQDGDVLEEITKHSVEWKPKELVRNIP